MLRDYGTMSPARRAGGGHRLCPPRLSAGGAHPGDHPHRRGPVPRATGRLRPPSTCRAAKCRSPATLFTNAGSPQHLRAASSRTPNAGGGTREAEIERARKVWSQGFVAEAIDRFCTHARVDGRLGPAQQGRADAATTWRSGRPPSRSRRLTTMAATRCARRRPWAQSPVTLQQLALLKGFNLDGADSPVRRLRASRHRGRQARLRRPRGLLRRPGLRRRADRDPAVRRLQRRPPQADRSSEGFATSCAPARSRAMAASIRLPQAPTAARRGGGERRRRADGRPHGAR